MKRRRQSFQNILDSTQLIHKHSLYKAAIRNKVFADVSKRIQNHIINSSSSLVSQYRVDK